MMVENRGSVGLGEWYAHLGADRDHDPSLAYNVWQLDGILGQRGSRVASIVAS